MPLILASTSPRRLELLKQIGVIPAAVIAPACDETPLKNELPSALVQRLALLKARTAAATHQGHIILAGDTVVACGRRILPKCEHDDEVRRCLALLSGRRHRVYGGMALINPEGRQAVRISQSVVSFKRLSEKEMENYIATREGIGKAGGYALQGRAAAFIDFISGTPSNIIGLDVHAARQLLTQFGYHE